MTLFYAFGCIFILSAVVWVPVGYWLRGFSARKAKPEIVRQVRADIDRCDAIYGDVTRLPFEGQVRS